MFFNNFKKKESAVSNKNDIETRNKLEREIKILVFELKEGKRHWYKDTQTQIIIPLRVDKMDEFGGNFHLPISEVDIRKDLASGNIVNNMVVKRILDELYFIEKNRTLPSE